MWVLGSGCPRLLLGPISVQWRPLGGLPMLPPRGHAGCPRVLACVLFLDGGGGRGGWPNWVDPVSGLHP
eukprot:4371236-Prorocentrum_lima.AAC.1